MCWAIAEHRPVRVYTVVTVLGRAKTEIGQHTAAAEGRCRGATDSEQLPSCRSTLSHTADYLPTDVKPYGQLHCGPFFAGRRRQICVAWLATRAR